MKSFIKFLNSDHAAVGFAITIITILVLGVVGLLSYAIGSPIPMVIALIVIFMMFRIIGSPE